MLKKIVFSFCLVCLLLFSSTSFPVQASIRTIEEAPGQILSQSRHSLRDNLGNTWQVILFKRTKTDRDSIVNLRLVDFPGTATFKHPQPLTITTVDNSWSATDAFAEKAPAPNVGQYDLKTIISQLPSFQSVTLELPLETSEQVTLNIPSVVVLEWQTVIEEHK